MELLDRYLYALRTYLPKAQQHDILAELSDTIQSEAEEQEAALGRALTRAEEEAILKRYGHPLIAAGRYLPQQYLIGPPLYPYYWNALKLTLIVFLIVRAILASVMAFTSATPAQAAGWMVDGILPAIFLAAAIVTAVFALLERSQVKLRFLENWSPGALPAVKEADAERIPLAESLLGLVFGTVFLLYWLGVPPLDRIAFGGNGVTVRLAPVWTPFYVSVAVLLLVSIVQNGINLVRPYGTRLRAATRAATGAIFVGVLVLVLRSPSLVLITDAAGDAAKYADKAAILNRILSAGLAITGALIFVDLLVNVRRLIRTSRRWRP